MDVFEAIPERIEVSGHATDLAGHRRVVRGALDYARDAFGGSAVVAREDRARWWPRVTLTVTMDPARWPRLPRSSTFADRGVDAVVDVPTSRVALEMIFATRRSAGWPAAASPRSARTAPEDRIRATWSRTCWICPACRAARSTPDRRSASADRCGHHGRTVSGRSGYQTPNSPASPRPSPPQELRDRPTVPHPCHPRAGACHGVGPAARRNRPGAARRRGGRHRW